MIGVTHTVEALVEIRDNRSEKADDPVLLPGDALRLSHWTTGVCMGRGPVLAARAAAAAAFAGGAHVSASAAARTRIETHWLSQAPELHFLHDGGDIVIVPDVVPRSMPLLPYVRHAVEEYLALRPTPRKDPFSCRVRHELRSGVAPIETDYETCVRSGKDMSMGRETFWTLFCPSIRR